MKTAVFEYTHKTEVDSSLAEVVYYNSKNYTMALKLVDTGWAPSIFYGNVAQAFYESFVKASSLGQTYNMFVKNKLPNLSEGTVYNVTYRDISEPIVDSKSAETLRYFVKGYIRVTGEFEAENGKEAAKAFLDLLREDNYDDQVIGVTEVEVIV